MSTSLVQEDDCLLSCGTFLLFLGLGLFIQVPRTCGFVRLPMNILAFFATVVDRLTWAMTKLAFDILVSGTSFLTSLVSTGHRCPASALP